MPLPLQQHLEFSAFACQCVWNLSFFSASLFFLTNFRVYSSGGHVPLSFTSKIKHGQIVLLGENDQMCQRIAPQRTMAWRSVPHPHYSSADNPAFVKHLYTAMGLLGKISNSAYQSNKMSTQSCSTAADSILSGGGVWNHTPRIQHIPCILRVATW